MYIPKGLTDSQKHNLAALIVGGLATLNEHWPQVTALVGQHYHGVPVPPAVTLGLQIAALCITAASRALSRAKSGTGTGIVGTAPDPAAIPAPNAEASDVPAGSAAAPAPDPPFLSAPVDDLLTIALKRLPPVAAQEIKAFAAQKVADAEKNAVKNLTNMEGFSAGELGGLSIAHNTPPAFLQAGAETPSLPPSDPAAPPQDNPGVIAAPDPDGPAQSETPDTAPTPAPAAV